MPVALAVEAACVALGMYLFLRGSRLPRGQAIGLGVLCLAILVFTVIGMTLAPPPPSALAMAGSSLITLVVVCALIAWLGRPRREGQA
jgi:NO-binding membrane sensor protein with MHYT domain